MNTEPYGLVLSGGGAKGAYHVGVIKALAESGIRIKALAGASIGALNGAVVAAAPDMGEAALRLERIWHELAKAPPLRAKSLGYYTVLLTSFGLSLSFAGSLIARAMLAAGSARKLASLASNEEEDGLLSSQPLIEILEKYVDIDNLQKGLEFHVSVYPNPAGGSLHALAEVVFAEIGLCDTRLSEFKHLQSIPREQQRALLMASAALPLLYSSREVDGIKYSDGGQGGWHSVQGNTPIKPLLAAGVKNVIVSHLSDGSLWNRNDFPEATIIEIRPQRTIARGKLDMISFNPANIHSWMTQGYEDTLATIRKIQRPLDALSYARSSAAALMDSLSEYDALDAETRSVMSRVRARKNLPTTD